MEPRYSQYLQAVEELSQLARERYGKTLPQLAVRWLLDQPGVSAILWGARKRQQLDDLAGVWGWSLEAEARQAIDEILHRHVPEPIPPASWLLLPAQGSQLLGIVQSDPKDQAREGRKRFSYGAARGDPKLERHSGRR